jgi:hypothetical protein
LLFDVGHSLFVFFLFFFLKTLVVIHLLKILQRHILTIFLTWSKLINFMVHFVYCCFLN